MKEKFKKWFGLDQPEEIKQPDINHAAAALMIEIMAADNEWSDIEAKEIAKLLHTQLNVSIDEVDDIINEARESQKQANDLFQFTKVVNAQYNNDQKYALLVQLWRVAYADGQIDRYEEHMLRKLADLLHLAHSQFIKAKIEART